MRAEAQAHVDQINDALLMTCDEPVSGLYEDALLSEMNQLLAALRQRSQSLM